MASFVVENNIGLVAFWDDIENVVKSIRPEHIAEWKKNTLSLRNSMSYKKNIQKLVEFLIGKKSNWSNI
jgi:RPA family protein